MGESDSRVAKALTLDPLPYYPLDSTLLPSKAIKTTPSRIPKVLSCILLSLSFVFSCLYVFLSIVG